MESKHIEINNRKIRGKSQNTWGIKPHPHDKIQHPFMIKTQQTSNVGELPQLDKEHLQINEDCNKTNALQMYKTTH